LVPDKGVSSPESVPIRDATRVARVRIPLWCVFGLDCKPGFEGNLKRKEEEEDEGRVSWKLLLLLQEEKGPNPLI
jgi:hypothetical protein